MDDIKKILSKRLKGLNNSISVQDKEDAMKLVDISRPTIDRYLRGQCFSIDTATELLQFFESRINNRKAQLNVA